MPTFKGPTQSFAIPSGTRLFDRIKLPRGVTVYSTDSGVTWKQSLNPWQGDLIGAEGIFWFLGGHTYSITNLQAANFIDAGFAAYISPFPDVFENTYQDVYL